MAWLLGAGALGLLLIALPVELHFSAGAGKAPTLRLVWLFGLLPVDALGTRRVRRPAGPKEARAPSSIGRRAVAMLRTPGFPARTLRFCSRLFAAFTLRLRASAEVGLDDPADTGELHGWLCAALAPLQRDGLQLRVAPNFEEPGLRGEVDALLRFSPVRLLAHTIGFALSGATLRALLRAARA